MPISYGMVGGRDHRRPQRLPEGEEPRRCASCGMSLPSSSFRDDGRYEDGKSPTCPRCERKASAKRKDGKTSRRFARNLDAFMKGEGLDVAQAAKKGGVSANTVRAWLSGSTLPKTDALERFCRRSGASADMLLGLGSGGRP